MSVMSMTGFGRGTAERDGKTLSVELKSVNHRFLDLGIKLPRMFNEHEDALRKQLQKSLARGHVDVFVKFEDHSAAGAAVAVNKPLLAAYIREGKAAAKELGVKYDLKLSDFLRMGDLFTVTAAETEPATLAEMLKEAVASATEVLLNARRAEGQRLSEDITLKLNAMEELRQKIEQRAPLVTEEYRQRLHTRVAELLEQGSVDENRLGAEIALFADRSAIDEELVRLKSHILQGAVLLKETQAVGRQLDFLVQEMNREVNTICSKSQDKAITAWGLQLKNEVEKIREQVQNIE